jgi:L-amino acid N-acyltransferase YncA
MKKIIGLKVRKALLEDSSEILRWRNNPETIKFSKNNNYVTPAEHNEWFRKSLDSRHKFIYIGVLNDALVGIVVYSKIEGKSNYEVSINVAPEMRSIGLGKHLYKLTEREFKKEKVASTIISIIQKNNIRSISLFTTNNYELFSEEKNFFEFRKNLD